MRGGRDDFPQRSEQQNVEQFGATLPPEILSMYEISGQDPITRHSFDRYIKDKKQDQAIRDQAEKPIAVDIIENKKELKSFFTEDNSLPEEVKLWKGKVMEVPEKERAAIIRKGFHNPDANIQIAADRMIINAPERERVKLVEEEFNSSSLGLQKEAVGNIWWMPVGERTQLMQRALSSPDATLRRMAMSEITFLPIEGKEILFQFMIERGLANELVEPPLYDKANVKKEGFERRAFTKTGSGTTLIGGDLRGKTIIRHMQPRAFLTWQDTYENYGLWSQEGFDYVPVEPIQSYKLNKNGLVDVHSGVLDLSIKQWLDRTHRFESELYNQQKKIIDVLKKKGIKHGHTHDNNFCLRFFRDENGNVDLNRVPRVYLIDFDEAVSN